MPSGTAKTFVDVLVPLALHKAYTYAVPADLADEVVFGSRVEVQFGKSRHYAAFVIRVHREAHREYQAKEIISLLDQDSLLYPVQTKFWEWMASYYACSIGEVLAAAVPAGLKLSSETRLLLRDDANLDVELSDEEYLVAEALEIQEEISLEDVQSILDKKRVYPVIQRLLDKGILTVKEELKEKYKPRLVDCVRWTDTYDGKPEKIQEAFELVTRSERQERALLALIQLDRTQRTIKKKEIYEKADVDHSVMKALEKKGIIELYEIEQSRIHDAEIAGEKLHKLNPAQEEALTSIRSQFKEKEVVLLHGVTGSGKTRMYIELIKETRAREQQVLYLLPEIALSAQLIRRLEKVFGPDIVAYHSKLNNNERVEVWQRILKGQGIVIGARSSMFLPFKDLGLIIIDEEHDPSFKQVDPAPRYHARDAAIYLAMLHEAKSLLGTATPSLESYHNSQQDKYGYVFLRERVLGLQMPELMLVNMSKEHKQKSLKGHFSSVLLNELREALERKEQAILFQNRRGFAPALRCATCGWHATCIHCDVSLTYHKHIHKLKCHYCGYQIKPVTECPACGNPNLDLQGFGTEKIENELRLHFEEATIKRMDWETVRGKHAHNRLIEAFEAEEIDILVGTQMVTKGLDFDNVGIVGVLSADQQLNFPDFRSAERSFQLITQVSGRAGRKFKQGKVIIQAYNTGHPVLHDILEGNMEQFYQRELSERFKFGYPPYRRLIQITLKHKKQESVNKGAAILAKGLKERLGKRVFGPAVPHINRIRNQYIVQILIKLEKKINLLQATKTYIDANSRLVHQTEGLSGVRINIDVDPL